MGIINNKPIDLDEYSTETNMKFSRTSNSDEVL